VRESNRLYLIDAYNLLYRYFHGMPMMTTRKGEPTNAILGLTRMVLNIMERQPEYMVAAFDVHAPTLRKGEFADYKANRKPMPDELRPQIARARELFAILGVPVVDLAGHEADDIIGTVARSAAAQGIAVTIVSGDRDNFQLVNDLVSVMAPQNGSAEAIVYTPQGVRDYYANPKRGGWPIEPRLVADLKALAGDASDNIPGVPGIGDKGAAKLVATYGDVEAIIAAIPLIKGTGKKPTAVGLKLEENVEVLRQAKSLTTIKCDLELDFEIGRDARWSNFEVEAAVTLFEEMELNSLKGRLWRVVEGAGSVVVTTRVVAAKPIAKAIVAAVAVIVQEDDQLDLF
jgi:DNA polymerase I